MALAIMGPVAIILAVWRSLVAQRQAEISHNQLETNQRSLKNDQFQKAVEMIGSELPAVRLGAIDSLLRLSRSYPKEFHLQVMRLLAAYVRHPPNEAVERPEDKPREEIQIILVNIGERSDEGRKIEEENDHLIDLQGSNLRNVWLQPGARLDRVRLCEADLSGAILSGIQGLTQSRIHDVKADKDKPPKLENTVDRETGKPLKWPI